RPRARRQRRLARRVFRKEHGPAKRARSSGAPCRRSGLLLFEVADEGLALLRLPDAGEDHLRAGHELLGVLEVLVEIFGVPDHARVLVRVGIGEAGDGAGLASDDAGEARTHPVLARFDRVTGRAVFLEDLLAVRLSVSRSGDR